LFYPNFSVTTPLQITNATANNIVHLPWGKKQNKETSKGGTPTGELAFLESATVDCFLDTTSDSINLNF